MKRSTTTAALIRATSIIGVLIESSVAFVASNHARMRNLADEIEKLDIPTRVTTYSSSSSSVSSSSTSTSSTNHLDKDDDNEWRRHDLFGTSLVEETLSNLKTDKDFQETSERMSRLGTTGMTKEERTKRRRALDSLGVPSFSQFLTEKQKNSQLINDNDKDIQKSTLSSSPMKITRKDAKVLQINIGLYCNQACSHCHVESSPLRTESMTTDTIAQCLQLLQNTPTIQTLDITGGAPELNPNFRYLVSMARDIKPDLEIIDRCNLTVLQEPNQEDLVEFLAKHRVRIVASLPCYGEDNVDEQRGNGVFQRSISALLVLNEAGYGVKKLDQDNNEKLTLDLVYNPSGAFLPPSQSDLELKYKEVLQEQFGIQFNNLFTMTNMPVKRFADHLYRNNQLQQYMELLVQNYNDHTLDNLMCRDTISIGFDGALYDCDFNQQLGYSIGQECEEGGTAIADNTFGKMTVYDIDSFADLKQYPIFNDNHCFGCTAGSGSS